MHVPKDIIQEYLCRVSSVIPQIRKCKLKIKTKLEKGKTIDKTFATTRYRKRLRRQKRKHLAYLNCQILIDSNEKKILRTICRQI